MINRIISLQVDGIKLAGQLYLPTEGDQSHYVTVCLCHGIPAAIPNPSDGGYPLLAERICREGFAVLIFNFRGCGMSGGNLDLLGWTRDLKAAIDYLWVLPGIDRSHLALFGFSGGAAVSIYVASQDMRVSSILTCACPAEFTFATETDNAQSVLEYFRSIGTIRDKGFPHSTQEWLGGFRFVSPIEYVSQIAPRPLLLVHGSDDELVDVSHAYQLYDRAGEPKQIIVIDEVGHRLRQNDRTMAIAIDWLKSCAKVR
jgi:fermentation-respiration switch protein FrsA (DUF1100 family)